MDHLNTCNQIVKVKVKRDEKPKRCIACGTENIKPGRRYCSPQCRQKMTWVLSLSKGLLRTLSAKQAAFFFTNDFVVLDVIPAWSKEVSRFIMNRKRGNKPADDLKELILECGKKWHEIVENNKSQSYASFFLATENLMKEVNPNSIIPDRISTPRLSDTERHYIRILRINRDDLVAEDSVHIIKAAYKRMAKVYHPDAGGDENKFKLLNEAHEKMLLWAENPQFTCRRALKGCWSYDGSTSRWTSPL